MANLLDEFVKEAFDLFEVEGAEKPLESGVSYLEPIPNVWGGGGLDFDKIGMVFSRKVRDKETGKLEEREKWVTVADEIRKASSCGNNALKLKGVDTGFDYYKFMFCFRWLCEKCGSKGGRIHRKRMKRLLIRLVSEFEKQTGVVCGDGEIDTTKGVFDLRQFVFTTPLEIRKYFMSKADITALNRICERLLAKVLPDRCSLRYFHGFGDKNKGAYSPHVNIHQFEFTKQVLKLEPSMMQDIKSRYVAALKSYLLQVHQVTVPESVWVKIDFHYSFLEGDKSYKRKSFDKETGLRKEVVIEGIKLIMHRIEYMSRPCPGYCNYDEIKGNGDLLKLFVLEMKGFHYISNCGSWSIRDDDRREELEEMQWLAGEKLKVSYDNQGHVEYITRAVFNAKFLPHEYDELLEGFYRIKGVEGAGKKKKRGS